LKQRPEPIFEKQKLGKLTPLKKPDFIEAETLPKTKTLICKTQNANLTDKIILKNQPKDLTQVLANGLRYLRVAGVDSLWEQGKPEARKMLVNRAESHTSGARFVGWHGLEMQ